MTMSQTWHRHAACHRKTHSCRWRYLLKSFVQLFSILHFFPCYVLPFCFDDKLVNLLFCELVRLVSHFYFDLSFSIVMYVDNLLVFTKIFYQYVISPTGRSYWYYIFVYKLHWIRIENASTPWKKGLYFSINYDNFLKSMWNIEHHYCLSLQNVNFKNSHPNKKT